MQLLCIGQLRDSVFVVGSTYWNCQSNFKKINDKNGESESDSDSVDQLAPK